MILNRAMITDFIDFMRSTQGVILKKSRGEELYRGMWGDRIFIIREHPKGTEDMEWVEVFYPIPDKLEQLDQLWSGILIQRMQDEESDNRSGVSIGEKIRRFFGG